MKDYSHLDELLLTLLPPRIEALKIIAPNQSFTSKQLCIEVWDELIDEHKLIGRRIKALTNSNQLPLEPAGRNSANHQEYRLK